MSPELLELLRDPDMRRCLAFLDGTDQTIDNLLACYAPDRRDRKERPVATTRIRPGRRRMSSAEFNRKVDAGARALRWLGEMAVDKAITEGRVPREIRDNLVKLYVEAPDTVKQLLSSRPADPALARAEASRAYWDDPASEAAYAAHCEAAGIPYTAYEEVT